MNEKGTLNKKMFFLNLLKWRTVLKISNHTTTLSQVLIPYKQFAMITKPQTRNRGVLRASATFKKLIPQLWETNTYLTW